MKEILRDRRMACAITLIIIIASVLTNAERKLNEIRRPIHEAFYTGSLSNGNSVENDLQDRIKLANNFITVAQKYVAEDSALIFFTGSQDELIKATKLYEKYTANQKLTEASNLLYNRLKNEKMTERDSGYVESIYANLNSRNNTISFEASLYNDRAKEFNRRLKNFPGNMVKSLGMVAPLEIFEGVAN